MQNPVWQPGAADTSAENIEILYIDGQNRICTVKLNRNELSEFQYQSLAWRDWTAKTEKPKPDQLLLTTYWNYQNGKFWPWNARKPPGPKLKTYLKVRLWQRANGTTRIEYSLLDNNRP